ncbi:transporter substrate-binding domain-containing protein [Paucibacter sp. APW11]|uniref:Transporter substrate-binding domain-containing protein n=1 Tax=Roseateles aquae TaxID=3077235 RepID=A0ABU3PFB1_9BURK|nr:transporter substrate-binding domain-containing protein [Paucibacter sp. APW11]MDT9000987.1 transporter substrate-binding domain-containing protein [Paucibacter sp. APW11]
MKSWLRVLFAAAWLGGMFAAAPAAELVLAVDTSTEMPLAQLSGKDVVDGLHHDLGLELARRLQRRPRFLALPRMRIVQALEQGEADLVCIYLPPWLPGPLDWSKPFIPQADWLVSRTEAKRPQSLADLVGQRIGTVHGFSYPALSQALGAGLVRDDAPSSSANLRKLALGRVQHAVVSQRLLEYTQRERRGLLDLHPPLLISEELTQCARSRRSSVSLNDLNAAIDALAADGTLNRLQARYR